MNCSLADVPIASLYAEHRAGLVKYVSVRVHDRHAVEDLVHDAFLRAMVSAPDYDGDKSGIRSWLTGHAACAVQQFRWEQGRDAVVGAFFAEQLRFAYMPGPPRAMSAALMEALAKLSAQQRRAVELRYLEGLSFDQCADVDGRHRNTFFITQKRALANLRKHMGVAR